MGNARPAGGNIENGLKLRQLEMELEQLMKSSNDGLVGEKGQ